MRSELRGAEAPGSLTAVVTGPLGPPPSSSSSPGLPSLVTAFPVTFRNAVKAAFTVCPPTSVHTFPLPVTVSSLAISGVGKGPAQEDESVPSIGPQWPKGRGVGWWDAGDCVSECA